MSLNIHKIDPMESSQLAKLPLEVQQHIRGLEEQNAGKDEAICLLQQMDVFPDILMKLAGIEKDLRDSQYARLNRTAPEPIAISLEDHQGIFRHPDAKALIGLTLEMDGNRINIFEDKSDPDARVFTVELQDDTLRVMAYNALSESPVVLTNPKSGEIAADADDYRSNRYKEDVPSL